MQQKTYFAYWRWILSQIAVFACAVFGLGRCGAAAEETKSHGNVILVRGIFTVFSLGLDDLAKQLREDDIEVQVTTASLSHRIVDKTRQEYAEGKTQGPIVLIGHSLGGDLLPSLARRFDRSDLPVDLMIMIDSTNPSNAPSNVRRCVNLYQSNFSPTWFRIFRGAPIEAEDSRTQLLNVDIRELDNAAEADKIDHFNIEASPWIHQMVTREIRAAIPAIAKQNRTTQDVPRVTDACATAIPGVPIADPAVSTRAQRVIPIVRRVNPPTSALPPMQVRCP